MANINRLSFTISEGASISGAVDLNNSTDDNGGFIPLGSRLFGIVMPATWTAANLTFQGSWDGGATWHNITDAENNEITVIAGADKAHVWVASAFAAVPMIKVRSGTSLVPVNQVADRAITLILRSI